MLFQRTSVALAEQRTEYQENIEAFTGETVTLSTELPEAGLEVTWVKDNIPLSLIDSKYETVSQACSYELVIPDVTLEDGGIYKAQGGGYESASVQLTISGESFQKLLLGGYILEKKKHVVEAVFQNCPKDQNSFATLHFHRTTCRSSEHHRCHTRRNSCDHH